MPDPSSPPNVSEYNQASFLGGMDLQMDDTHLPTNKYRIGFNVRNRYDRLDAVFSSVEDKGIPKGVIQELVTFGNYLILFVSGNAYYKYYTSDNWVQIVGFAMSATAPRYWTCQVPISETNYYRLAATSPTYTGTTVNLTPPPTYTAANVTFPDGRAQIAQNQVASAAQGNLPGLVVQDNINQPRFIFLDNNSLPTVRTVQTYAQWKIGFTDGTNTIVGYQTLNAMSQAPTGVAVPDSGYDQREYVPIGNSMCFNNGVLYVTSQDFSQIYRSVSGRPLDFIINVKNTLTTTLTVITSVVGTFWQLPGGDATTTAYSVGVGGITTLKSLSDGNIFVSASGANFAVEQNMTNIAPTIFGEFTFIRRFLFNATCLSDRCIFDTLGDTRFIDLLGVRSFNAVLQTQNEGRNTPFTSRIQPAFGTVTNPIIQDASNAAGILFNDFELYAVNTSYGPAIAVFDTTVKVDPELPGCWVGFDLNQTAGKKIKIFAKIELTITALYAVTEDNRLFRLYIGPTVDTAVVRTAGVTSGILYADQSIKMSNPKREIKLQKTRVILNNITNDITCSMTPYVNNRQCALGKQTKDITYLPPVTPTTNSLYIAPDVDTMLYNGLFSTPAAEQGWKTFSFIEWTGGSLTQYSMELSEVTPKNPLNSQA
jgi:hypothetical protein